MYVDILNINKDHNDHSDRGYNVEYKVKGLVSRNCIVKANVRSHG